MDKMNWHQQAKEKNPFKVPGGYFEGLESRIMQRIQEEEASTPVRKLNMGIIRWVSGVAAALVIGFIGFHQFHLKPAQVEQDLYSLVEYYAQDMDDVTLAMILSDDVLESGGDSETNANLLDYMGADELTVIETILEEY